MLNCASVDILPGRNCFCVGQQSMIYRNSMNINSIRRVLALAIVVMAFCLTSLAQTFNLSKYTNVSSGLPNNYVYSLVQDQNGFIWIGLSEGLSKYDGNKFTNYTKRDSLADNYVSSMLIDTDGRLWCGHGNGNFSVHHNGRFRKVMVPDVASPIKDMCLDDKGNVWAIEQNKGIIKIDPTFAVTTYFDREKFGRRIYYSIRAVNAMTLLVGTSDGVMIVKLNTDGSVDDPEDVEDLPSSGVNCITTTYDGREYLVGTEDGEVYRYSIAAGARKIEKCTDSCSESNSVFDIRSLYETENGDIYIGTWGSGLKEWKFSAERNQYVEGITLKEDNGLGSDFVTDIIFDREGIFWFATYGGGAVAWINNYFAQYDLNNIGFMRNKIVSSTVDENSLWMGLDAGLIRMDKQCMEDFDYFDASSGLPMDVSISSICFDKKRGVQYVGTTMGGIYRRSKESRNFKKIEYSQSSRTSEMINGMAIYENNLYIASQGGFITYDVVTGDSRCYTTMDGLPHNNINFVYVDNDGAVWMGPKDSGITQFTEEGFDVHRISEDVRIDVAGMAIDDRDRSWLATVSNGIFCLSNDSVVPITVADGLVKNYCYGIASDGNGRMWVCHQPGLSSIDLSNGVIRAFNVSNGVGQEFSNVYADESGDLWFTSSTGVVHYISQYDKRNLVAPIINLTRVSISGKRHEIDEPIDLPYPYDGNVAKFEFDFIGISMKDPLNVRYEYWLQVEGNEVERWMPLGTQNHKEFDFLPDGNYVLHVRAFNSDGMVCARPLEIPIHISAPFWKSVFFPIVLLIIVIVIVRMVTRWREEKLRERQRELEAEVNRQTITLREQKGEIERKNHDIMDSINYAKRIQTAILPPSDSLLDYPFAESFIFFVPRDVVSGDFYWFSKFDNKILICCGDCTGHGVPGAFMSMICAALLNDATHSEELRDHPAKLLEALDKEIKATLNKNQSVEAQDGMDCAMVLIDFDTLEMSSAAARRPVYLFNKGKLNEIRGARRGVGEHRNSNEFVETVTQLRKGDSIYLSSDGFASQFGGAEKMPYSAGALKRFIERNIDEHMDVQKKLFEEEFRTWMGSNEQIDDVIVMGIRI